MSDIQIEQDEDGWDIRSQDAAYAEGDRVIHMDSGHTGKVTGRAECPVTGRRFHLVEFDDGTCGNFAQRSLAPSGQPG